MQSKLGVYLISLDGIDVPGYLETAAAYRRLDGAHLLIRGARRSGPANTLIVWRHFVDDKDQIFLDDPEGRAEQFFAAIKGDVEQMRGIYDAWMGYNDSVVQSHEAAEKRR